LHDKINIRLGFMGKKRWIHKKKKGSLYRHSQKRLNGLETQFAAMLKRLGIKFRAQYILKDRIYDFYLPEYETLIEVDGDYWHCNPRKYPSGPVNKMQTENRKNDVYKDSLAKAWGFNLLRIWEYDIRNKGGYVSKNLIAALEAIKKGEK